MVVLSLERRCVYRWWKKAKAAYTYAKKMTEMHGDEASCTASSAASNCVGTGCQTEDEYGNPTRGVRSEPPSDPTTPPQAPFNHPRLQEVPHESAALACTQSRAEQHFVNNAVPTTLLAP